MRRLFRPVLNLWTALALLAIVLLVAGFNTSGHRSLGLVTSESENATLSKRHAAYDASLSSLAAPAPIAAPKGASQVSRSAYARPSLNRKLARKASLDLIVGDVGRAIGDFEQLARSLGGDITKLDDKRPSSPDEHREADLTLVVPASAFDTALSSGAKIGGVRSENVSAEDVGDQLVDQTARLRNLRRTESDLLKIMDRSGKVGEILEVQNQLSETRDAIEKLDAENQALKARVATSTIDVHLAEEIRTIGAEPTAASQLGDAWASAWHASREAALGLVERLIYIVAFAPYWLVLGAIVLPAVMLARRRASTSSA